MPTASNHTSLSLLALSSTLIQPCVRILIYLAHNQDWGVNALIFFVAWQGRKLAVAHGSPRFFWGATMVSIPLCALMTKARLDHPVENVGHRWVVMSYKVKWIEKLWMKGLTTVLSLEELGKEPYKKIKDIKMNLRKKLKSWKRDWRSINILIINSHMMSSISSHHIMYYWIRKTMKWSHY
mgnify:CR=1 FL=1